MSTLSPNRGLVIPQVGNDTGLWGGELNQTITDLDMILGQFVTLFSSTLGNTITLSSSEALSAYLILSSTGVGPYVLNFPSSNDAIGLYSVGNKTLGPVTCQSTAGGRNTTLGAATTNIVFSDGTNVDPAVSLPAVSAFTTGDVKMTFKNVADSGWVFMNDGTIGSSGSGASTRANADCQSLFTLLWTNVSQTYAPVSGGRGGSALADWNANKTIGLPLALGRAFASAGQGSGLSNFALGQTFGEQSHTLSIAEMPNHNHSVSISIAPANNNTAIIDLDNTDGLAGNSSASYAPSIFGLGAGSYYVQSLQFFCNAASIGATGGSGGHNNIQPSTYLNIEIKL